MVALACDKRQSCNGEDSADCVELISPCDKKSNCEVCKD